MRVIRCDRCGVEREHGGSMPPFWRTLNSDGAGMDEKKYELCPECAAALKQWLETAPPEPVEERAPATQQLLPVDLPIVEPIVEIPLPELPTVITDEDIPF